MIIFFTLFTLGNVPHPRVFPTHYFMQFVKKMATIFPTHKMSSQNANIAKAFHTGYVTLRVLFLLNII